MKDTEDRNKERIKILEQRGLRHLVRDLYDTKYDKERRDDKTQSRDSEISNDSGISYFFG